MSMETIFLTKQFPIQIDVDNWIILTAKTMYINEEHMPNRQIFIRVLKNKEQRPGRFIVNGYYIQSGVRKCGGEVIDLVGLNTRDIGEAIYRLAEFLGASDDFAAEVINSCPPSKI